MAISSGSNFTASDFNNLKSKITTECNRRSVEITEGNATAGTEATASLMNTIISPLNAINSATTSTAIVEVGNLINPVALEAVVATFASKDKVGSASGCASGCMGLCQGCTGTCTGGCTGSCTGSCSGCSGSCTGSCQGCTGSCAWGCQGFQSSDYYCY